MTKNIIILLLVLICFPIASQASEYLQSVEVSSSNATNPEFAVNGDTISFTITTDTETDIESVSIDSLSNVPNKTCNSSCIYTGSIAITHPLDEGKITLVINHGVIEGFGELHTNYLSNVKFVDNIGEINKFSDITISSNNTFSQYAVNGDDIDLEFTVHDLGVTINSVTIAGQAANLTSVNGVGEVDYTATLTVNGNTSPQTVSFVIDSSDGSITEVSDDSSVEIVNISNGSIFNSISLFKGSVENPKKANAGDELAFVFDVDRDKFDLTTITKITTPDGDVGIEDTDCNFAKCILTTPAFEASTGEFSVAYEYNFLGTAKAGSKAFSISIKKSTTSTGNGGGSSSNNNNSSDDEIPTSSVNGTSFLATVVDYDGLNGDLALNPIGKLPAVVEIIKLVNGEQLDASEEELVSLDQEAILTRIAGNQFISIIDWTNKGNGTEDISLSTVESTLNISGVNLKTTKKGKLKLLKSRKAKIIKLNENKGKVKLIGKRLSKAAKFAFLLSDGTYQTVEIKKKGSKAFRQILEIESIPENALYAIYYTSKRGADYLDLQ